MSWSTCRCRSGSKAITVVGAAGSGSRLAEQGVGVVGAAVVGAAAVAAGVGEHRVAAQRLVDDVVRERAGVVRAEQPQRGVRGDGQVQQRLVELGFDELGVRRVRPRWVARCRGPGAGRRGTCR